MNDVNFNVVGTFTKLGKYLDCNYKVIRHSNIMKDRQLSPSYFIYLSDVVSNLPKLLRSVVHLPMNI